MPFEFNEHTFIGISIPLYAIVIGTEIVLSNLQVKGYYSVKETLVNVYFTLLNAGIDVLFRSIYLFLILQWFYDHQFFNLQAFPVVYWLLLFIFEDLAFYAEHRVDHYCRFFWAVHVTHHSSEEFNLTTGFRSSVFQPLYRFIYFIPLTLVGFKPLDIVLMYSITQVYGILVHTQMVQKMPRWFEVLFVSPSHHRVHHASNTVYLDKNMGMCLIIWDKLFGTFQEELPAEPVRYGLTKPLEQPHHPFKIIFHEWWSIGKDLSKKTSFINKLKYLFMPPGWSHDGSSKTAKELRNELNQANQSDGNASTKTSSLSLQAKA